MTPLEIEYATKPLLNEANALEKKAKELRVLAAEYEEKLREIYGAHNPIEITLEALISAIRRKNGRVNDYATRLNASEGQIMQLIEASGGKIKPDARGWLRLEEDLQAAA
jgi:hypothetical protein